MKIVVTGAKGFVGSVFSLRAVEEGHEVLALDDESRGLNQTEDKIGDAYRKFDCIDGIADAIKDRSWDAVDAVVHFAAATGSLDRPLDELIAWNVDMTQKVYADALKFNAKHFLWPTTSLALEVPESPYVESKERALRWLRDVDTAANISTPVRFFNVAGAYKGCTELRKNEVHMLPMMFEAWRAKNPFIINGGDYDTVDGTPSRCFVHVVDVVEYLMSILNGRIVHPNADGAVWLGHRNAITVRQAIALFEQFVGRLETRMGPRRAFDCGRLLCDHAQTYQFEAARAGLAPAWVSFRDELDALQNATRPSTIAVDVSTIRSHQTVGVLPDG